ncbi:relaxase/mobilization nuclease domain-containing protein [Chitinophaga filiformis]|uniref:relaxase/mobilization nuclease domain-containing protein n=1 Tax=Chitinophaga filiformis TaxID=104663 RepID=UPI001F3554BA|nr:relaxase/mobilization nuclease domain-containing protein [Chitinophaga filiformis]MCF6404446.1 relaxase/mobilization nuclease domain-containing protein [Chitinophaga filiformis]
MIGYVGTGASFYECIRYCLEDKKGLSEDDKQYLSARESVQHKNRAEVLFYNQCFGNKYQLAREFKDVSRLSKRVENPVFHFALRLAPGELLDKDKWMEVGAACAKEFGVAENQYICILHKDTREQHIHVVANRVGFDGKVASDSNSYRKMAALCRRLERQFELKEVLSPRAFLPPHEWVKGRSDTRRIKLANDIRRTLVKVKCWEKFAKAMEELGYVLVKGRGIVFIDEKKVRIKGSEVGFSLSRIERFLGHRSDVENRKDGLIADPRTESNRPSAADLLANSNSSRRETEYKVEESNITRELKNILELLLRSEYADNHIPFEMTEAGMKKKKKKKRGYNRGLGY